MGRGQYGKSGMSGMVMSAEQAHDPSLVRVVTERRRLAGKQFSLVSPFAGKRFALRKYQASLDRVPLHAAHAVFYDNSQSRPFQSQLLEILKSRFDSYTLIEDRNQPVTVELVSMEGWPRIAARCAAVYGTIYGEHVPGRLSRVLNLEDDVEIPVDAWRKLNTVLDQHEAVATVIGNCRDRRPGYDSSGKPIAFNFEVHQQIGPQTDPQRVRLVQLPDRPFGVEPIGAGHMGCWLTKRDVLRELPIGERELHGVYGQDLVWGWRVNQSGRVFAIDWSVDCKHWTVRDGKTLCV